MREYYLAIPQYRHQWPRVESEDMASAISTACENQLSVISAQLSEDERALSDGCEIVSSDPELTWADLNAWIEVYNEVYNSSYKKTGYPRARKQYEAIPKCPQAPYLNGVDISGDGKIDKCGIINDCPANNDILAGNPVSCLSGAKIQTTPIFQSSSAFSGSLSTTYNSASLIESIKDSNLPLLKGDMGVLRNFSQLRTLDVVYESGYSKIIRLRYSQTYSELFGGYYTVGFKANPDNKGIITQSGSEFIHTDENKVVWQYNSSGLLLSKTTSSGVVTTYSYYTHGPGLGKVKSITYHDESALQFYYNSQGFISKVTDFALNDYLFEYDSNNNLVKIVYPDSTPNDISDNPNLEFLFEDSRFPNALTGIIDERGVRFATWSYGSEGKAVSSEHFNSIDKVELDFSIDNQTKVKEYFSSTEYGETIYRYDIKGGFTKVTEIEPVQCVGCSAKEKMTYKYDVFGNLIEKTTGNGEVSKYKYDKKHREISRTEAVGTPEESTVLTEWNEEWLKPSKIVSGNLETLYTYDGNGNITKIKRRDLITLEERVDFLSYNSIGFIDSVDGPRTDIADITQYSYDSPTGNLVSITNALGHTTNFNAYDAYGRPTHITDANGVVTELTWDLRGNLIKHKTASAITEYVYNAVGLVTQTKSPTGQVINYEHDAARRLIAISDARGNKVEYSYDLQGNKLSETTKDSQGNIFKTYQQTFNNFGELIKVIGAAGQKIEYSYDSAGNVNNSVDGEQNTSSQVYDALSRVQKVVDALGGVTELTYNEDDKVASVTDAESRTTDYEYNAFGDVVKLTSPDTGVTTFSYDSAGNVLSKTDSRGITTNYSYDALNRVISTDYADGSQIIYEYDSSSSSNKGVGRLTKITDASGTTEYGYNELGLLIKDKRTVNGNVYTTQYLFEPSGKPVGVVYPSGKQVTYGYDVYGKINELKLVDGAIEKTIASNMTYLPFGPLSVLNYGNGLSLFNTYDQDYRLTNSEVTGLTEKNYSYNLNNVITQIDNVDPAANDEVYGYDALSRLSSATGTYGNFTYGYDKIGNRTAKNGDLYTYQSKSNLALVDSAEDITFEYDANGNTVRKGDIAFGYNSANRLSSVTNGEITATYIYNGKGERSVKIVNGVETHFIYNNKGQLIAEANGEGVVLKEYIYLNHQPYAQVVGNDVYYYHNSHLGTPEMMTDENQNIVWQASYTPFGKSTVDVETIENNIRFPGQYYDEESGLHYNYFRDYDPETGRYIESDPIGLNAGVNTYGYVNGNPIMLSDPSGLCPQCWVVYRVVQGIRLTANALSLSNAQPNTPWHPSPVWDRLPPPVGLYDPNQYNDPEFPRAGKIPGTTEHRGELDTPAHNGGSGDCVQQAEYKYERCLMQCGSEVDESRCYAQLMFDLAKCRQQSDNDYPDWVDDGYDGF